jgi:hypothetical protein
MSIADLRDKTYASLANNRTRRIGYVVVAVVLAILCVFPQPYVGRAKVVPQDPSSPLGASLGGGAGRLQDFAALFGGGRRAIDLYLTIGQSEDVRNDVIRNLKLVGSSSNYSTWQAARVRLQRRVDIQSLPGGVIEIQANTHDADEALKLTRAYTDAIGQRFKTLNKQQLETKQTLITTRYREAATRLAQAQGALDSFRRSNRLSASPETELGAALTVRSGIEAQLQAKLVEQDTLQQFLGPENPRLIGVQSEVRQLRARLAQSVTPADDAGGPNAGGLTELASQYVNLYRDYVFAQSLYQIYTRISEEVAVEELSGQTAATVQVIEAPHVDAWRHYNIPAGAALALLALVFLFTEVYAPATGIVLWRRREEKVEA